MLVRLVGGSLRSSRRCWGVQRWCPRTTSLRPKRPRTTSLWPRRRSRTRRRRCRSRPTRRRCRQRTWPPKGQRPPQGWSPRGGGRTGHAVGAQLGVARRSAGGDALAVAGGAASRGQVVSLGASASTVWTSQGAPSGSWTHGLPRRSVAPDGAPKLARAPHTHRACRIVATPFVVEMETAAGAAPTEEDT